MRLSLIALMFGGLLLAAGCTDYAETCYARAGSDGGGEGDGTVGTGRGSGAGGATVASGCSKTPVQ